ncbi:unnamed protein product [Brassicogethes aeneus]|uniref:G-protein coupled receptors family 1 profile domain-containing protein n=1 Tax=Brassicogethes aeneus TaxID=1431903 RepID=A0A9P0FEJ3_BRAAE|nr:unnamed protein product [Brassicogethes aeneus]
MDLNHTTMDDWDINTTNQMTQEYLDAKDTSDTAEMMYSLNLVVPFTIIYGIIFVSGVLGNVSTCVVIAKNKSMQTATNYYLFSLALSDMLLLVSGLPPEMYKIWSPQNYVFGETFCFLQGFAAEMSANATVLTITAFTVERYLAICHPFLTHTMSKLSRAIRYIIAIWLIALGLAVPQAIQFGILFEVEHGRRNSYCQVVTTVFDHAFEISTFVFFVAPMTLITILYILIGIQLRKSKNIAGRYGGSLTTNDSRRGRLLRTTVAQNRVVKMLIAVVAAFFICWAPFHTQRLLAVYMSNASHEVQKQEILIKIYTFLMYASGLLYFLSTTINPLLYHILSNKFRKAYRNTFSGIFCSPRKKNNTHSYTAITRIPPSSRHFQRSISDGIVPGHERQLTRKTSENIVVPKNASIKSMKIETLAESRSSSCGFSITNNDSELMRSNNCKIKNGTPSVSREGSYFSQIGKQMMQFLQIGGSGSAKIDNDNNTISNSSLKDMDEVDFNSEDLVNYMNEINRGIHK